jgi:large-conductance mechanosensitive channel
MINALANNEIRFGNISLNFIQSSVNFYIVANIPLLFLFIDVLERYKTMNQEPSFKVL